MRPYFGNYQITEYNGIKMRNIMHSAQLAKGVIDAATISYPYTLEDGDSPTIIAFDYYGSVEYVWLIFLANNITDPYTQWYKSQEQFDAYILKKYGAIETAMSTIHHYTNLDDPELPDVTPITWANASVGEFVGFTPVYAYDWESSLNEPRRVIKLIDRAAKERIAFELEKLLR